MFLKEGVTNPTPQCFGDNLPQLRYNSTYKFQFITFLKLGSHYS